MSNLVWTKVKNIWWVGEKLLEPPEGLNNKDPKKEIQFVKFFGPEEEIQKVGNPVNIEDYESSTKEEHIRKGLKLLQKRESMLKQFIRDVQEAEKKIGGDENIIEKYSNKDGAKGVPRKSIVKEIFKPVEKKTPPPAPPTPVATVSSSARTSMRKSQSLRKAKPSTPTPQLSADASSSGNYVCGTCGFSTNRVNVIAAHNKVHSATPAPTTPASRVKSSPKATVPTPARASTRSPATRTPRRSVKVAPKPKVVPVVATPTTPKKTPGRKRKAPATPQQEPPKEIIEKEEILADWSDAEEDGAKKPKMDAKKMFDTLFPTKRESPPKTVPEKEEKIPAAAKDIYDLNEEFKEELDEDLPILSNQSAPVSKLETTATTTEAVAAVVTDEKESTDMDLDAQFKELMEETVLTIPTFSTTSTTTNKNLSAEEEDDDVEMKDAELTNSHSPEEETTELKVSQVAEPEAEPKETEVNEEISGPKEVKEEPLEEDVKPDLTELTEVEQEVKAETPPKTQQPTVDPVEVVSTKSEVSKKSVAPAVEEKAEAAPAAEQPATTVAVKVEPQKEKTPEPVPTVPPPVLAAPTVSPTKVVTPESPAPTTVLPVSAPAVPLVKASPQKALPVTAVASPVKASSPQKVLPVSTKIASPVRSSPQKVLPVSSVSSAVMSSAQKVLPVSSVASPVKASPQKVLPVTAAASPVKLLPEKVVQPTLPKSPVKPQQSLSPLKSPPRSSAIPATPVYAVKSSPSVIIAEEKPKKTYSRGRRSSTTKPAEVVTPAPATPEVKASLPDNAVPMEISKEKTRIDVPVTTTPLPPTIIPKIEEPVVTPAPPQPVAVTPPVNETAGIKPIVSQTVTPVPVAQPPKGATGASKRKSVSAREPPLKSPPPSRSRKTPTSPQKSVSLSNAKSPIIKTGAGAVPPIIKKPPIYANAQSDLAKAKLPFKQQYLITTDTGAVITPADAVPPPPSSSSSSSTSSSIVDAAKKAPTVAASSHPTASSIALAQRKKDPSAAPPPPKPRARPYGRKSQIATTTTSEVTTTAKPTAAVKPTMNVEEDSSIIRQALQVQKGAIKSSPPVPVEQKKETPVEQVVHVVPVQNPDGSVSYMFLSLNENDELKLDQLEGPTPTNNLEAVYIDKAVDCETLMTTLNPQPQQQQIQIQLPQTFNSQSPSRQPSVSQQVKQQIATTSTIAVPSSSQAQTQIISEVAPQQYVIQQQEGQEILNIGSNTLVQNEDGSFVDISQLSSGDSNIYFMTDDGQIIDPAACGMTEAQIQQLLNGQQ